MSVDRNNSIFNSSDEGESSLNPENSSPGVNSPNTQPKARIYTEEVAQDQAEVHLGVDLGRRLARLEVGNEFNKQKLHNVSQKANNNTEAIAVENARIDDLEAKVISLEARLTSEEKYGLEAKEKIGELELKLLKRDKEISELKEMLAKHKAGLAKQDERFDKLEAENCETRSQFVTLLDTCKTFNEELQSLKKMNFEIKKEFVKEETILKSATKSKDVAKIPLMSQRSNYFSQERVNQAYLPSQEQMNQIYNPNLYNSLNSLPAGPVFYPQVEDPTGLHFYPPGTEADMMYPCGSTHQSHGPDVNTDFSGYYYQWEKGQSLYYKRTFNICKSTIMNN